tara:strand:- start:34757 stop:35998 length:1242 start_codon:yes stop_codon:yes gene_type:complete
MFYFVFNIQEPNYFLCNEIILYEYEFLDSKFEFSYPKSCDQEFYHEGFTDFKNVFSETFNYQSRPLSILSVNLFYEIINIFGINSTTNALISTFLVQSFIVLIVVTLLENILHIKKQQTSNSYIFLSLIVLLSPLFKWGIFDPSHQLLTMLVIIFYPFLIKKNINITFKNSLLIGTLFLLHRSFLIGFIWYLFFSNHQNLFGDLKKKLANAIYGLIPYVSYNLFIYFGLNQKPYDANSAYWGQFVWLYDFVRGKVRYQSEWHCVSIPENFQCYFADNYDTLIYLLIPLMLILANHFLKNSKVLFKNYSFEYYIISLSAFIFIFWSFIGWYPPIRFSYYSIGNLIILIFALNIIKIESSLLKSFTLLSYLSYTLFLNHWNDPNIISVNAGTSISLFLLICLIFISIYKNKVIEN